MRVENSSVKHLSKKLWNDNAGFVVSIELILIATIAVIGLIAGMTAVRDGVVSELSDVAGSVQDLNQSYSINGVTGHASSTAGMDFDDATDFCDDADDVAGQADNCITFDGAAVDEF
jgi:Flp pilus assembly pilin Flp